MKHNYIVAWTTSNASAPIIEIASLTEQEAAEIERLLDDAEYFPSIERLSLPSKPLNFEDLTKYLSIVTA
jgi:hypothetical protein